MVCLRNICFTVLVRVESANLRCASSSWSRHSEIVGHAITDNSTCGRDHLKKTRNGNCSIQHVSQNSIYFVHRSELDLEAVWENSNEWRLRWVIFYLPVVVTPPPEVSETGPVKEKVWNPETTFWAFYFISTQKDILCSVKMNFANLSHHEVQPYSANVRRRWTNVVDTTRRRGGCRSQYQERAVFRTSLATRQLN